MKEFSGTWWEKTIDALHKPVFYVETSRLFLWVPILKTDGSLSP